MEFHDILMAAATQASGTAAAAASTYQRMLPNGTTVSETGSRQYVGNGVAVSETV